MLAAATASAAGPTWLEAQQIEPSQGSINGLSCASATTCLAASGVPIVQDNGLSYEPATDPDPNSEANAVSCAPDTHFCMFVDNNGGAFAYNNGSFGSLQTSRTQAWNSSMCRAPRSASAWPSATTTSSTSMRAAAGTPAMTLTTSTEWFTGFLQRVVLIGFGLRRGSEQRRSRPDLLQMGRDDLVGASGSIRYRLESHHESSRAPRQASALRPMKPEMRMSSTAPAPGRLGIWTASGRHNCARHARERAA